MIEYCRDYRRIRRVSDREIVIAPDVFYLMEVENGDDLGVWFLHYCAGEGYGPDGIMIHANMTEACRGRKALHSARAAIAWVFEHTETPVIYAAPRKDRRDVRALARAAGFRYLFDLHGCRIYNLERSHELQEVA